MWLSSLFQISRIGKIQSKIEKMPIYDLPGGSLWPLPLDASMAFYPLDLQGLIYVFAAKELVSAVIFVIWPQNFKIGVKNTPFLVKIRSKSTFWEIVFSITKNNHNRASYMAVLARKSYFGRNSQNSCKCNHFKVTRFVVKSENLICQNLKYCKKI